MNTRGWSLARQLVVLQICVVMLTVGIEAMVGVYRSANSGATWDEHQLLGLVALTEVALTVGITGSLLIADRVHRQTLGLEPAVIARQYQHHQAMLRAVREGLVITDQVGKLMLANDEARRLLRLPPGGEGTPVGDLLCDPDLAELFTHEGPVRDQVRVAAGRVLLVSRSPAAVDGTPVGAVLTLRDRTELQTVLRELDTVRALADALRAQTHESANRIQALVGLVELGRYEDAVQLGTRDSSIAQRLSDQLFDRVGEPTLVALLLGKTAIAADRGVELRLSPDTAVTAVRLPVEQVLTIVGNLVDNALDAAALGGGWVELTLRNDDRGLRVTVRDNGPGLPAEHLEEIFTPGWTTKPTDTPGGRGLGLALVRNTVTRMGGTISAGNDSGDDGGAVFHVQLPAATTPAGTEAQVSA
ncbi:MAG: sensor histidine kinase [Pseudonocardiaceae bacterium]